MCLRCHDVFGMSYFQWTLTLLRMPLILQSSACGTFAVFLHSLQLLTPSHSLQTASPLTSLKIFGFIPAPFFPTRFLHSVIAFPPHPDDLSSLPTDYSLASMLQNSSIMYLLWSPSPAALSLLPSAHSGSLSPETTLAPLHQDPQGSILVFSS